MKKKIKVNPSPVITGQLRYFIMSDIGGTIPYNLSILHSPNGYSKPEEAAQLIIDYAKKSEEDGYWVSEGDQAFIIVGKVIITKL